MTETALDATQTAQTRHYEGQQLSEALFNDWIGRAFAAFSIFSVIFLLLGAGGMLAPGPALLVAAGGAFVLTIALSLGAAAPRSRPVHTSRLPYNVQVLSAARNEPAVTTAAERLVIRGVATANGYAADSGNRRP